MVFETRNDQVNVFQGIIASVQTNNSNTDRQIYGLILMQPHALSSSNFFLTDVKAKRDPCAHFFFGLTPPPPPPPAWISRVFEPPSHENFHNPIRRWRGGGDYFLRNNLIFKDVTVISMADRTSFQCYAH